MKNHHFKIIIVFIVLSIMGLGVIPFMPITFLPDENPNSLLISFTMPNSPPIIVEKEATSELENVLSQLSGIDEINSYSYYNQGQIELVLDEGVDMAFKEFEAISIIRSVYPKFERKISYPIISRSSKDQKSKSPLLTYRINAAISTFKIQEIIKGIFHPSISVISGVKDIALDGVSPIGIAVSYDPLKLDNFHLNPNDLTSQVQQSFSTDYPGVIEENGKYISLSIDPSKNGLDDLNNLPIITTDHLSIPLKKLAKVYYEERAPEKYLRINGLNSVTISIFAEDNINRISLAREIKAEVDKIENRLPNGFSLILDYDDTEFTVKELNKNYLRSSLSLLILILLTLLTYRNFKYLVILISGLVFNISICLLCAWALHIQIHLYTIAGLTISFGLIIDNAIVMLDHYHKKHDLKITLALLAASLTTIIALLSTLLLPSVANGVLTELSIIIVINLVVSLLVSLFYTPAIYGLFFPNFTDQQKTETSQSKNYNIYFKAITWLSKYKKTVAFSGIMMFGLPIFLLPSQWQGHDWYNQTIGSKFYQDSVRPITDKALGGGLRLFVKNVYEKYSYRTPEKTKLYVNGRLPYGTTLSQTNEVFKRLEEYLSQVGGLGQYITSIYSPQNANIVITFSEPAEDTGFPYLLKNKLTALAVDLGGVTWNIYGVGQGYSNQSGGSISNFRVEMLGYNYDDLGNEMGRLADSLLVHPRVKKVNKDVTPFFSSESAPYEYTLDIDVKGLSYLNGALSEIYNTLLWNTPHISSALKLNLDGNTFPVAIKARGSDAFSNFDVLHRTFDLGNNKIKLSTIAGFELKKVNNLIIKKNRQYIRNLSFDYLGSYKFGSKYINKRLKEINDVMPLGYQANNKSSFNNSSSNEKKQYELLLVAIIGIYFICAILFESLILPCYVLLSIPFSYAGLFFTFGLFDLYFDQGGYAAFLLLTGLSVNAMIFIIHHYKFLSNGDIQHAVTEKTKPIILTVISTGLGLLPFLIGGQQEVFWFSFAVGTIGGMFFSLLGIFVFVPALMVSSN